MNLLHSLKLQPTEVAFRGHLHHFQGQLPTPRCRQQRVRRQAQKFNRMALHAQLVQHSSHGAQHLHHGGTACHSLRRYHAGFAHLLTARM